MATQRDLQIIEASKCKSLLKECRLHLDRAMYGMGDIDEDLYNKLRECYNLICNANDKL